MTGPEPSGKPARRKPRVAIAMPGGVEFGGIGRMMLYATRGWAKLPEAPDWWLVDARGDGQLLWSPVMLVRAIIGLWWRRPDLLHLNVANKGSTLRKLALSLAARRLAIPTIVHLHYGEYAADLASRPAIVQRQVIAMFQRAELMIVLGQDDGRMAREVLGVPAERIRVLHNAVPDPGPPPVRAGREGPVQLLFLGRFDAPEKGVRELLQALATPELQARDWHLVVAGRGERAALGPALERPEVGRRVTFTGWLGQAAVYELCRAADIFVLPSFREGQAMSLLEAMAHGLAIVTTPVGAHLEAVEDGKEALLVPPGDEKALAAALIRVIDSFALRDALGRAARQKYCCNFDADQYSKTLLQILGRVIGEFEDNWRLKN